MDSVWARLVMDSVWALPGSVLYGHCLVQYCMGTAWSVLAWLIMPGHASTPATHHRTPRTTLITVIDRVFPLLTISTSVGRGLSVLASPYTRGVHYRHARHRVTLQRECALLGPVTRGPSHVVPDVHATPHAHPTRTINHYVQQALCGRQVRPYG